MIRRPPRSTLFPTRRSSDLPGLGGSQRVRHGAAQTVAVLPAPAFKNLGRPADLIKKGASISTARSSAQDRKSTRLNSSHANISYAVFFLKKKTLHGAVEMPH